MAVGFRSASAITRNLGTVATPAAPAGVTAGDMLLAIQVSDSAGSLAAMTAPAGWEEKFAQAAASGRPNIKIWTRTATGSDTYTFPDASNADCSVAVLCLTGADATAPLSVALTHLGVSSASHVAPSTTGVVDGLLICAFISSPGGGATRTWTPPPGMTERTDSTTAGSYVGMSTATVATTSTAATGTKTATASSVVNWSALSVVIAPGSAENPVDSTDSATGTHTSSIAAFATVVESGVSGDTAEILRTSNVADAGDSGDVTAILRASDVTDSASGDDALFVTAIDHRASGDSAVGTESSYVDIPELFDTSDPGTGADDVSVSVTLDRSDVASAAEAAAILRTSNSNDAATTAESLELLRASNSNDLASGAEQTTVLLRVTTSTDTAAGTEAIAILRISTSTDTAAGTEDTDSGPFIIDTAVGTEDISIVEIAFTQVLPLVRRTTYDLVVVAMIPNAAGAPSFLEIDPLEWSSLRWANTLSRPQELSATCLLASVPDSVLDRLEKLDVLPTELWLYRDGRKVFAGPLLAWQTRGEQLQVEARGLLSYLQSMVVDSDLKYSAIDQHLIAKGLVDHYQALPYGHLGIDTAAVTPSGVLRDMEYVAAEQHQISRRVEELGALANGFDAEVDPSSRALQLWTPQKGADRSTGEDAIILDSRNITTADLMCSVAPDDLASESYATASVSGLDEPLVSKLGNAELRARIGRRSVLRSFSNAGTQAELDAANQAVLDARARALIVPGPSIRVTPDADLSAYGVGDTVGFDLRAPLRLNGAFRIRKQQVTVSADGGDEAVDLEFV